MVSYSRLTYIETLANELVLESFGNKCNNLSLPRCQACDLSCFGIRSLLTFSSYVVKNASHHRTIDPHFAGVNFSDCLQQQVRRLLLQDDTHRATTNCNAMRFRCLHTG